MAGTLVGCSTTEPLAMSVTPGHELIEMTTVPEGVNVEVPGFGTVRTPANVYLDPAQTHELRFYLHGYDDHTVTVDTEVGEWTSSTTGRTHALEPAFIHLDMASGERLMTGAELSAWATAESSEALTQATQIQAEVSALLEEERASFHRTERAMARAERQIARARAILARDNSRAAVEASVEARERAIALRDEQHGMERLTLDHLDTAEALLVAAQREHDAMIELAQLTDEINAAALEQERVLAIRRGVMPVESIEEALAKMSPEFEAAINRIRSGNAFAESGEPLDGQPALTGVPADTE